MCSNLHVLSFHLLAKKVIERMQDTKVVKSGNFFGKTFCKLNLLYVICVQ